MSNRVVISGIGIAGPNGATTEVFWDACMAQKNAATQIPSKWLHYYTPKSSLWAPLAPIDYSAYDIGVIEKLQLDKSQLLAIATAHQALQNANISIVPCEKKKRSFRLEGIANPDTFGIFIGTGAGGISSVISAQSYHTFSAIKKHLETSMQEPNNNLLFSEFDSVKQLMAMPVRFNPFTVSMMMPNGCASTLGIRFNTKGPNRTFSLACASGTVALGAGFNAIRDGSISCALCGGVEYLGDEYGGIFRSFDCAGTLVKNDNPSVANRPFDRDRNGFLFSEGGGAMLLLEDLDHALQRNAPIIAEITGYAESFDAHSIMAMEPNGSSIESMLHLLMNDAGRDTSDIDYINSHGTGTETNDEIEAAVIERVFGRNVKVNSTKSLIGHTLGACGAIEAAVTALCISNKSIHGSNNIEDPIRDLSFVTDTDTFNVERAITQSFAFGGHNAALLLENFHHT